MVHVGNGNFRKNGFYFYFTIFFIVLFENMQKYLILTAKYPLCSEGFLFWCLIYVVLLL